jgi:hypothetical protein
MLVVLALSASGCGKKPRHLDPPPLDPGEQPHVYPKKYPPPDSPGERL